MTKRDVLFWTFVVLGLAAFGGSLWICFWICGQFAGYTPVGTEGIQ